MTTSTVTQAHMKSALTKYVECFGTHDVDGIVALFAESAVIHDPVGKPPITDTTTVRDFFTNVLDHVQGAKLDAPIRGSEGNAAAFSFEVYINAPDGGTRTLRAVDVMTFDDDGRIVLMQAYHGPDDRE